MSREWTAKWIGRQDGDTFNPVFFKDFTVDYPISRATLYITALGVYEAYMNGQRIGNAYLTPLQKDDGEGVPYDQYDITDLVTAGPEAPSNSIDIFLGKGWKEDDDRIAVRAEIVLERSGEPAEEALAMEFDELTADPGYFADDDYELDDLGSFLTEEETLFDGSDALLDELIAGEPSYDDAPELPELPEVMDMPDTVASRENTKRKRRVRKRHLSVVQDPDMEAAGVLLADEEPVFEYIAEPKEVKAPAPVRPKKTVEEDLYSEDMMQDLFDESDFLEDLPDSVPATEPVQPRETTRPLEPVLPGDIPIVERALKKTMPAPQPAEKPAEEPIRPAESPAENLIAEVIQPVREENEERGFSDTMPSETEMSDEEIRAILAAQEKQMAASIPKFFEQPPAEEEDLFSEEDLESALAETGDFSFEEAAFDDMDSLADEIADELGGEFAPVEEAAGEASEMTEEEASWYGDVEGQVSFDFLGKIQEIMDEEKQASGEEGLEESLAAVLEETVPDKSRFDTKVLGGEFDSLMSELMEQQAPEEVAEELPEDLFEEISGEITEGGTEAVEDGADRIEESVKDIGDGIEDIIEEATAEEISAAEEEPAKKESIFRKHLKKFDLAKKIGLTLGEEEEEPEEADEYDAYDDEDLAKLDELGELLADSSQLADMEAVLAGLDKGPAKMPAAGPGFGGELPSFEDLFAAADVADTHTEKAVPEDQTADAAEEPAEEAPEAEETAGVIPVPLTISEEKEQPEPEPEPIVIFGTDETWSYYGSDIEENHIHGYEIFNRLLWDGKENPDKEAVVLDPDIVITDEPGSQLTVLEERNVQFVIPAADTGGGSAWILDFGKPFSGLVSFQSEIPAGTKITLTFMDTLKEEGSQQQFIYHSDGIQEMVCPHFALFHGRYVKVEGWSGMPDAAMFTGYRLLDETEEIEEENIAETEETAVAEETEGITEETAEEKPEETVEEPAEEIAEETTEETGGEAVEEPVEKAAVENEEDEILEEELETLLDEELAEGFLPETSFVSTSEEQLNRAAQDLQAKQDALFASFDAGEKVATGEMCALMQTAVWNAESKDAAMRYFGKLREAQTKHGKAIPASLPDESEDFAAASVTEEGEAVKAVWSLYEAYGDPAILEENYDLIKDTLASVSEQNADGVESFIVNAPKMADDDTDPSFVATVSYYEMAGTAAKAAKVLQKEEDEKHFTGLAGSIREAFLDEFFSRSGRLAEDTQTAYILALKSGLCDNKEKLAEDFLKQLKRDRYQLKCGKEGREALPFVLADMGESELAYRYLMNDWMTENAEAANGKTAAFVTGYVNGIQAEEPGYTKVKIAPVPNFRLIDSAATCQTPQGTIVSNWDVNEEGRIHFHFVIPEGIEAKVVLPDCAEEAIREQTLKAGAYDFDYLPTKDYLHLFNEDSLIGDLLKYDESVAILEEADASVAEQIQNADADLLTKPLSELPVDAETLSAIKKGLFELK